MALKITNEDLARGRSGPAKLSQNSEDDAIGGFVAGLNKLLLTANTTINSAKGLMENYNDLKYKLGGQKQQFSGPQRQMRPIQGQVVETAARPAPAPAPVAEERSTSQEAQESKSTLPSELPVFLTEEQRLQKAENLFNEMHEKYIKPNLAMLHMITAAQAVSMMLQPENKKKLIEEIAKRL